MKKIWLVMLPAERRLLLLLLFVLFCSSVLELTGLVLVIPYVELMIGGYRVVDIAQIHPALEWMLSMTSDYRLDASIWFIVFYLLKNAGLSGFAFSQHGILKSIQANLMNRMYRRYLREPYVFHLQARSADLVRSITYDAFLFGDGVLVQSGVLIAELLLFLGVLVFLSIQNPAALMVVLVMVVPLVLIYLLIKTYLRAWGYALQKQEAKVIKHLQEGLGGIKDVSILNAQHYFEQAFYDNVSLRAKVKRKRDVAMQLPRFMIETLMMAALAVGLLWLEKVGGIEGNLSTIAFLAMVTVRLMPVGNRVLASINAFRSYGSSVDVVYESAKPDITNVSESFPRDLRLGPGGHFELLEIDKLCFAYPGEPEIIHNLDISIRQGETLGVVGSSGSGKTTLIDLILGLLVPESGRILRDGSDIHSDLRSWQQDIGYVQQSVFLLDASIRENIAFGVAEHEIDDYRIDEIIKLVELEEWVGSLKDGVMSIVGERGVKISGGQRQRIGLGRALYHDPDILVLDEATSALDNLTEQQIMDDIYSMQGKRTLIIIAHRLDTIRRCDRIIVLDKGCIVGEGGYDQLVADNEHFRSISLYSDIDGNNDKASRSSK